MLSQRSWTVLWVDTKIRGLEKKPCTYLNFGLFFEFWDMKKPDLKFFRPDLESEKLDHFGKLMQKIPMLASGKQASK